MDNIGILVAVAGLIATIAAAFSEALRQRMLKKGEQTTEERIGRLSRALREAVRLIDQMQQEISTRSKLAEKLQQDVDRYNELVKVRKPEVEAVAQLLRQELQTEGKKSFWRNIGVNALFFALGIVVTVGVTLAVR